MDFSVVRVQTGIPEMEVPMVKEGEPAWITVDELPGRTIEGKVTRFSYALDENTRTMLTEIDLPNEKRELRPGMYVTVRIGVEKHENALLVPGEALVMEKTAAFIFRHADGKARKTPVTIGFNDGKNVEVLKGLSPGDEVILAGERFLWSMDRPCNSPLQSNMRRLAFLFFYGVLLLGHAASAETEKVFASQRPAGAPQPINLVTVLKLVGANNLDVQIAVSASRRRRRMRSWRREQFFPSISPGLGYRRHEDNIQAVEGTILNADKEQYTAGAAATAQVDLGDAVSSHVGGPPAFSSGAPCRHRPVAGECLRGSPRLL